MINIVTVNYNNFAGLKNTLLNIESLKKSFEFKYIIIDGGSTDKSLDLLASYSHIVDVCVSEADSGIYNAMNKSSKYISDGYVIFMNSGDIFVESNFAHIVKNVNKNIYDLFYGDYIIDFEGGNKFKSTKNISNLWKGMFCHQSLAVRHDYLKKFPFDEHLNICADTYFILSVINSNAIIKKVDFALAIIEPGGLSDINRLESVKEQWRLTLKSRVKPNFNVNFYFLFLYTKNFIKTIIRIIRS